jgi:iron complex outermembrane recepter protein
MMMGIAQIAWAAHGREATVGQAQSIERQIGAVVDSRSSSGRIATEPAETRAYQLGDVTVTGKVVDEPAMPAVVETLTAEGIERINAVDTSDVFKYMPGAYLRKLYPGSTNRPLVIRGNSSFMTARTQVLMDGIQISDFLGAGHGNSPKWFMAAPQEIEQVDVIYGPFSAALSGNAMSGTALITTGYPRQRELTADVKYFHQRFHEYRTDEDIHGYSAFASVGERIGPLSLMVWYDRLQTDVQPISFATVPAASTVATPGTPVDGWAADTDPKGNPRLIFGSPGVQSLVNNTIKVKAGYDLTAHSQIRLVGAFWDSRHDYDRPESYLRDASGNPVYSGIVAIGGQSYAVPAFTYQESERQNFLYGLSYDLHTTGGFKIKTVLSAYDASRGITRVSGAIPQATAIGGPGRVADTVEGWYTADLMLSRGLPLKGLHTVSIGYHFDRYFTDNETWNAADWKRDDRTSLRDASRGKTRTQAVFAEDAWDLTDQWSVYLGARYEWWKAYDGAKAAEVDGVRITTDLPDRRESNLSPKLSTTFRPTEEWRLRYSLGWAHRYPTVGEMFFGSITPTGVINNANPDLRPEKVLAQDFTVTRVFGHHSEARLTFFQDDVTDAINSQTNFYTNVRNFQNIDEVRTRGIEFALNVRRFLIPGLGLFTNLAYTDATILRNDSVPASVGKTFPRVPQWRIKGILDYAPTDRWFVTLAGQYTSDQYSELDNSDIAGGYGGVDEYFTLDARLGYRFARHWTALLGVDNITDELYHVAHPYPRRTYYAELKFAY